MFTHSTLHRLASAAADIHLRNASGVAETYAKGEGGLDVVSATDLRNERDLRALLREALPDLAFLYGEENGFEKLPGDGYGALIDPIDGTRPYTQRMFCSGVSVGFCDGTGVMRAGFIVRLNNQWPGDMSLWTWDGETVRKDGAPFTPPAKIRSFADGCVSVTNIRSFPEDSRMLSAAWFLLAADRCRGPMSVCSGASEVLAVLEGRLAAFVNPASSDMVSHAVAVGMAKSLGFYVRHCLTEGSDFTLAVTPEGVAPAGDLSLAVSPMALRDELDALIRDGHTAVERLKQHAK